jgi:hypothetical protein
MRMPTILHKSKSRTETVSRGHGSQPNDDVLVATDAAPTRFEEFVAETAIAWR